MATQRVESGKEDRGNKRGRRKTGGGRDVERREEVTSKSEKQSERFRLKTLQIFTVCVLLPFGGQVMKGWGEA